VLGTIWYHYLYREGGREGGREGKERSEGRGEEEEGERKIKEGRGGGRQGGKKGEGRKEGGRGHSACSERPVSPKLRAARQGYSTLAIEQLFAMGVVLHSRN
jgi:hypothetical protein